MHVVTVPIISQCWKIPDEDLTKVSSFFCTMLRFNFSLIGGTTQNVDITRLHFPCSREDSRLRNLVGGSHKA